MSDYVSNDLAGAAYLSREDYDDDRPTRAEAERDAAEDDEWFPVPNIDSASPC